MLIKLTPRQQQILQMLVDGKTPKEIARLLVISHKTVEKHLIKAREKFGVRTRAEMIARAVARGNVYVYGGDAQIELP